MPAASTMKPEPSELTRRGERLEPWSSPPWPRRFLKNSSKNSSTGEPGGSCGPACCPPPLPPPRASTFCEVEMLTTASITFSATSAMFSGPRAKVGVESAGSAISAAAIADNAGCRRLCARMVSRRAISVKSPKELLDRECIHAETDARDVRRGNTYSIGEKLARSASTCSIKSWSTTTEPVDWGGKAASAHLSASNQPNQHHAHDGRRDTHQPQRAVGRLGDMRHRALHRARQSGEQDALDGEHQTDRDQKVRHSRQPFVRCFAGAISASPAPPRPGRYPRAPSRRDRRNSGRTPIPATAPCGCHCGACPLRRPA